MLKTIALAALCVAALPVVAQTSASPAKKELVQKLLLLQQPGIESVARGIVERPAMQLMQAAGQALQTQVPPDKREATGRSIETDVKKFVEDAVPLLRERAVKLAPTVIGPVMEEKLTEDELKQLIGWLESPVNKKYQQIAPELQDSFSQKLIAEAGPLLDSKLQALQQKVRGTLESVASTGGGAGKPASKPASSAPKPAKAASK
jgi:uncharacterized protein